MLHYQVFPGMQDRTLVMLHGFMGNTRDWLPFVDELLNVTTVVLIDLPGHGKSLGGPDGNYQMESAGHSVVVILDALKIERTSLLGYSMGGRIAMYTALQFPKRCSCLITESAHPGQGDVTERLSRVERDNALAARLESGSFEGFLKDWYHQPLFTSLYEDEALYAELIQKRLENDPTELAKALRGFSPGLMKPMWEMLADAPFSTLALCGEKDTKYTRVTQKMQDLCRNLQVAIVPGAGHNIHLEQPQEFLRIIKDFLK